MNQAIQSDTDLGDYLKTFACTAVMLQSILAQVLQTNCTKLQQIGIGITYDLIKFTAPAFIFGIIFSTVKNTPSQLWQQYPQYLRQQWHALFVPSIWWTLIYLVIFPNEQQVAKYHNLVTFLWQMVNGNAAPHLWYNTMMLQFIILMPIFWWLQKFTNHHPTRAIWLIGISSLVYLGWLNFYQLNVFHGLHQHDWYLLDRLCFSFFIYAVLGVLTWNFQTLLAKFLHKIWPFLIVLFFVIWQWTNHELFSYGYPVKLQNAPYYKLSMTLYCVVIISLIAALAFHHLHSQAKILPVVHFLARYAYRAYLSNVCWSHIIWQLLGKYLRDHINLALAIMIIYLLTWCLAFLSAIFLHWLWQKIKTTRFFYKAKAKI